MTALASRAARMGSSDPEGAAQEAVKRSLANDLSRPAIEYFFHDRPAPAAPEWTLLQLLGWLHGVLQFVVREERARAYTQREIPAPDEQLLDAPDRAPSQLEHAIDDQLRAIVRDCLSGLSDDYRSALLLRLEGAKYAEIAARLGVNENTVATWVRRGTRDLVQQVRDRMHGRRPANRSVRGDVVKASHA